jgi:hypothetical protein
MSRVISTDSPGKARHQQRRNIAEALRRLSQKRQLDDESKDLAALIVLSMHEIANTVDRTIDAWEKRDYFMKAERFREQWRWLEPASDQLSAVIYEARWDELPAILARLMPHFADVTVKKLTRKPSLWRGAYDRFIGAA